jgi:hypothetical protein
MTSSIRKRVVLAVVALTLPILALGSYALYAMAAGSVRDSFDHDLRASTRVLADLGEHDEEGFEFELEASTARVLAADRGVFVVVWRPDGTVLYRTDGAPELSPPEGEAGTTRVATMHHAGESVRVAPLRLR